MCDKYLECTTADGLPELKIFCFGGKAKFIGYNLCLHGKTYTNMYDYDNREDFEDYGKHCWLLTPWKGYRSATIVGQTDKGYIVQVSSGAEIVVYPDEIEID